MPLLLGVLGFVCSLLLADVWVGLSGAGLGFLLGAYLKTRRRLDALEQRVMELARQEVTTVRGTDGAASAPAAPVALEANNPVEAPLATAVAETVPTGWGEPPPRPPSMLDRFGGLIWSYFTGGNLLVRVGVVILFFGVAFLLRYAAEQAWVPIGLRLAGVAAGGLALFVLGWRLRARRFGYGLALQGGGVGILYLVVFAAFRLYGILPPLPAFTILVACALLSAVAAVLQEAPALAVLGVVGGFLAPVLASTGSGDHVALFAYYLVLNASILVMAWFKAWRALNLVGFAFTFIIASLWGWRYYRPVHFATTEPFLIAFFLFYVAIAVLFAVRQPPRLRGYVDGTLVFGAPLIGFGLQAALVSSYEYGLAWSALILGGFYLGLSWGLLRRSETGMRTLAEAFLALGVVFATLAIPLGLDARWTSASWALEGGAMIWIGVRQGRLPARLFGVLLQLAAGISFALDGRWRDELSVFLNADYIGALLLALAGLGGAFWLWRYRAAITARERYLSEMLFAWGLLWWLGGGIHEIAERMPLDYRWGGLILFLCVSAGLAHSLAYRLSWPMLRYSALGLLPALALATAAAGRTVAHPMAQLGWLGWPAALFVHGSMLFRMDRHSVSAPDWAHAGGLWLFSFITAWELAWAAARLAGESGNWGAVIWGLTIGLILGAIVVLRERLAWPLRRHRRVYLGLGGGPMAACLWFWIGAANLAGPGEPWPVHWLPLLNHLDLTIGFVLLVLAVWLRTAVREVPPSNLNPRPLWGLLALAAFVWLNAMLIRTLHYGFEVPFTVDALFESRLAQAALTLLWSVTGVFLMLVAGRRRRRWLWLIGAGLMAAVVIKLFLLDLAATGTVERIVAFLAVGVLLLVVGYFAPAPPRRSQEIVVK